MKSSYVFNLSILAVFFFSCLTAADAQVQNKQVGRVRVTFQDFQYFPYAWDPTGGDWRSFNKLGPVTTYFIYVFPAANLDSDVVEAQRLGLTVNDVDRIETEGRVGVSSPNGCYIHDLDTAIVNRLRRGEEITFLIPGGNRPSYVDIPVPAGAYFIRYQLFFQQAKFTNGRILFPNYIGLDPTNNSELQWGNAYIKVSAGGIAELSFDPTWKCVSNNSFAQFSFGGAFFSCQAFDQFLSYLVRIGDLPLQ